MTFYIDNVTVEQLHQLKTLRYEPTVTNVSATTIALTSASSYVQIVIGSTAGQIFTLPNATTLQQGWAFRFWNDSTTSVTIKNFSGTTLTTLSAGDKVETTVRDVSTTNGIWIFEATAEKALALVQSQRTTDATFTTAWADVSIDTTDYESDDTVIEHNDTDRARFDFKETGYYQVSYQFTAVESGGARLSSRFYKNGTTSLDGSDRFMEVGTDVLNAICVGYFVAGDYVTLQLLRAGGTTGTAYANIVIYILKLGGSKGERGEAGSGSTLTIQSNGVSIPNTPHSVLNFRNMTVSDAGGGVANVEDIDVYGSYVAQASSDALSTTTSTTYQQKLRLTTATLIAGTYRIGWMYDWQITSTNSSFNGRVQLNDTTTLMDHLEETQDAATGQRHQVSGFAYVTLTAATHTIDIVYRTSNSAATARIQNARLEIWRVS